MKLIKNLFLKEFAKRQVKSNKKIDAFFKRYFPYFYVAAYLACYPMIYERNRMMPAEKKTVVFNNVHVPYIPDTS